MLYAEYHAMVSEDIHIRHAAKPGFILYKRQAVYDMERKLNVVYTIPL